MTFEETSKTRGVGVKFSYREDMSLINFFPLMLEIQLDDLIVATVLIFSFSIFSETSMSNHALAGKYCILLVSMLLLSLLSL